MSILINIFAFIVAVGILVTFHEYGHYWVAKRLGVRVLRFSVGFGKPLWKRVAGDDRTEYVVAAIPLGGYVKMLDEREGKVDPSELQRAFNRQSVWRRIAIVAAGPLANFLFAILAYWLMFMIGVSGIKPVVGDVNPSSPAAEAGLREGDQIRSVNGASTPTWQNATLSLLDQALETERVELEVSDTNGQTRYVLLDMHELQALSGDGNLLDQLGISPWRPKLDAVIGDVVEKGAAQRGGLLPGDRILAANGQTIEDWTQWVEFIRAQPKQTLNLQIERNHEQLELALQTDSEHVDGRTIGRIGAYPQVDSQKFASMRVLVRYGPVQGFGNALNKTWDISALTLRVLWKLIIGEASLKNISGPVTIAQFAGVSALIGVSAFLSALAIFSISIGILNLMPVPVLDGGHLLYYFIEVIKGSPVSEQTEAVGQRIGLAMLAGLMALAFYNDFVRLLG